MTARRLVVVGTVVAVVARALLVVLRTGPVLMADEAGYLGNARALAGGTAFEMGASPFYRSGYSLVLAPLLRLDVDPTVAYRLVLLVNAVLAATLVPLLYALLRRAFDVEPRLAAGAAIAGAAFPSVTTLSRAALSENLLFPLVVCWLLAIAALASRARLPAAVAVGATGAALWIAHGRMIVVAALTAALLAEMARRRRVTLVHAAAGLSVLVAGVVVGRTLDRFIVERAYDGRRTDQVGDALAPLRDFDGWLTALRNAVGQSWYLLVVTFGVVAALAVVGVPAAVRRMRDGDLGSDVVVTVALVAATGGLLAVSALWFDAATRPDQLVYGRYLEPIVPPLIVLGLVSLARVTRLAPMAGSVAVASVVIAAARATVDFDEGANRWNVASLPFVTGELGPRVMLGAGTVAVGGAIVLWMLRRRAAHVWFVLLALFLPTTAFTELTLVRRAERGTYPPGWELPRREIEAATATVGYDMDDFHNVAAKVYQWELPDTTFVLFDGSEQAPPAALFFASPDWDSEHPEATVELLWRDPARRQVLWRSV